MSQQSQQNYSKKTKQSNYKPKPKNEDNKNQALADINPNAKPMELSGYMSSFTNMDHGSFKVEIDDELIERYCNDAIDVISSVELEKNHVEDDGRVRGVEVISNSLCVGTSLAVARKLFLAVPQQDRAKVSSFMPLETFDIRIPASFVPLLDIIGKTKVDDKGEINIRVKYDSLMIKRFLTKGLQYIATDDWFVHNYVEPDEDGDDAPKPRTRFRGLVNADISKMVFEDEDSVRFVKDKVKDVLHTLLSKELTRQIPDPERENQFVNLVYCVPQLDLEDATRIKVLTWLGKLNRNVHSATDDEQFFTKLICCGILLLMEPHWLNNPNRRLRNVDADLRNVEALGDSTVLQALNFGGFHHVQEYIDRPAFRDLYENLFSYYSSGLSPRLNTIFYMVNQGQSAFGSIGQLVYVEQDRLETKTAIEGYPGFNRRDLRRNTREAYSAFHFNQADPAVRSASYGLVKDIEFSFDFWLTFSKDLGAIRRDALGRDNILNRNVRK